MKPTILTLNSGSSSIKFAFYRPGEFLTPGMFGKLVWNGLGEIILTLSAEEEVSVVCPLADGTSATGVFLEWLEKQDNFRSVKAVGHRVVHGMERSEPEVVTPDLLDDLRRISPFAPEHLPIEIDLIETFQKRRPELVQVACFDTAFHRSMPQLATLLPIPRRFEAKGVRRYGFHGLSYAYLMEELARLDEPVATKGRVILCHLGNGASMSAVRDGQCMDTSMGFSPTSGLVMSTRTGDLDPGVAAYLGQTESIKTKEFYHLANHESGLLGISETSSDMRHLLKLESSDLRAAEAVELFCYQAKKWIGSFSAVLGELDALVFSGGIGENSAIVRARICEGLRFLGVKLNEDRNTKSAPVISSEESRVSVRVIPTNEELMIARSVAQLTP